MRPAVALAAALTVLGGAPAAKAASPQVRQLVVFRDGSALQKTVSTRASTVRVGGRRCSTGKASALSALVRSRPGTLQLLDFGSCSLASGDGGGLFVKRIRTDANRGQNGWVYKVGRRAATAGAADPSGPFGRGRLRGGQRVTWFYCRLRNGGCQRTLDLRLSGEPGSVVASVRGYDDEGRAAAVAGASVTAGAASALTDAGGEARLEGLAAGRHLVVARKQGAIRSFAERVDAP
jgi:hypothetical protein